MVHEHTDLPEDHMLMAASHTHSATSSRPASVLKPDDDFNSYQRFLAHRIADGVRRAINNLEPARIGWGTVDVPEHVNNRRWLMKPGLHREEAHLRVDRPGRLDQLGAAGAAGSSAPCPCRRRG